MPTRPVATSARPVASSLPAFAGEASSRGSRRIAANTAAMPMGRLTKKIHCQPACSTSRPPSVGPKTGARMIGTPIALITRAMFFGPAARTRIIWPIGISMPPPRPCSTRAAISVSAVPREPAERGARGEEHERDDVEAAGAEARRGPAGDGDHGGEREHVAGDDPLDAVQRRVEVLGEGVEGDVDDRRVEHGHDRAEDHHDRYAPESWSSLCLASFRYQKFSTECFGVKTFTLERPGRL